MQDCRATSQPSDREPRDDLGPESGVDNRSFRPNDGVDERSDRLEYLAAPDELEKPRSRLRTLRAWLLAVTIVVLLATGARFAGQRYYNPASRVPAVVSYSGERGLFGANAPILTELEDVYELVGELGTVELTLSGDVFDIVLPRTFGDRLFGKRREQATVFYARTGNGRELRFLALRDPDTGAPVFAIDTSGRRPADDVLGTYLALPDADDEAAAPVAALAGALSNLLPRIDAAGSKRLSAGDYTVFGPFDRGRVDALKSRVESNYVVSYQVRRLAASEADVTMVGPLFMIESAPKRGTIRGIYASRWRTISEPLWGTSDTSVLVHELTHAYIDRVLPGANARLSAAARYFEDSHPRLYGEIVDELYSQLGDAGRAEETLAFLMGSIAAGDTRTVAPSRILQNQAAASTSEAVLSTDVELLIDLGLLPACMHPGGVGHTAAEITFDYYDDARDACKQ